MREEPLRPKSIVGIVAPIGPNRKGLHSVPVCMRDLYSSIQLCLLTPPQSPREIIEEFLDYANLRGWNIRSFYGVCITIDDLADLIEEFETQKEKQ